MAYLKMLSTGSTRGNCYIYKDLMIDCGCAFIDIVNTKVSERRPETYDYLKDINFVFISHKHKDHIRESTVKRINRLYPHILFVGGENMEETFKEYELNYTTIKIGEVKKFRDNTLALSLIHLYHDIENYGIRVFDKEADRVIKGIYATDTVHLEGITAKGYDWYLIEANYCEIEHKRLIGEHRENTIKYQNSGDTKQASLEDLEANLLEQAMNSHLSMQQANIFIEENANKGAEVMFCHITSRYDSEKYLQHFKH